MEKALAKLLVRSEGPSNIFHPNSVWNHRGKQFGAAFVSREGAKDLDDFFELDFDNTPMLKKQYISQTYMNFEIDELYLGVMNWTKTSLDNPHLHFKGFWENQSLQQNFYPEKTILIVRKISIDQFDTYFINDNDPFFEIIKEKISLANSDKPESRRLNGFVFLDIDFDSFQISDNHDAKDQTFKHKDQPKIRRSSDPKRRKATELYAEEYVKNYLSKKGFRFIEKFGAPYDLKFLKEDKEIRVEVKGSTLNNISIVEVTENEILHSHGKLQNPEHAIHLHNTNVYIALVEDIKINKNYNASEGELVHFDIFKPFSTEEWRDHSMNHFLGSNVSLENNCKFKFTLERKVNL